MLIAGFPPKAIENLRNSMLITAAHWGRSARTNWPNQGRFWSRGEAILLPVTMTMPRRIVRKPDF
jgi:hypothetical protein